MESVFTRLCNNVHQSATEVAVLRIAVARQDSEFTDGIQIRNDSSLLTYGFLYARAVNVKPIGRFALPMDRKLAGIRIPCDRNRSEASSGRTVGRCACC